MSSEEGEVVDDCSPFFRVHRSGHFERLAGTEFVPPSTDSQTGVSSKDVVVVPETGLSARLFLPNISDTTQKLPLLIYFHGGGFCLESAFNPRYHQCIHALVSKANVVAVSIEYRLAPEHPLPIAYEDCWAGVQWVASHSAGEGPDEWLTKHADFEKVFLAGDSAGANITHHLALKAGKVNLKGGVKILGAVLVHPYFLGEEATESELKNSCNHAMASKLWQYACPSSTGKDDPYINPFGAGALSLSELGCSRVLLLIAEKDPGRDRGWRYCEKLSRSEWNGDVKTMETEGEGHVFHLENPASEKAVKAMERFASFLNKDANYCHPNK